MKLLFSADVHAPADGWAYEELGRVAREQGCALVAVAGDLLNLFGRDTPGAQAHATAGWLRALAARVPHVAVCSGNHDPDDLNGAGWLVRAAAGVNAGNLLVDGASAVLSDHDHDAALIVSACPYWNIQERGVTHHLWLKDQAEKVWKEGRRLADRHPGLPWVMLHHEPPEGTRIMAGASHTGEDFGSGAFWAAEWCRTYRPDYLLCGHIHPAPFVEGGAWADRVPGSPTWAFNPGRVNATGSRMVEVDSDARTARWLTWDGKLADVRALDGTGPGPEVRRSDHPPTAS